MTFLLDTSVLGGGLFRTQSFGMAGEFREIQFRFVQSVANEDLEVHFMEIHYDMAGVSAEASTGTE